MASIRITVTASPTGAAADAGPAALAALAAALRDGLEEGQRVTRMAGLSLPGAASAQEAAGADRIFMLDLPDGDVGTGALRALGGWLMRHPSAQVALKADGPSGGVSLRLARWSAVAFAAAVARAQSQLAPADAG
ncbi:hypothetical protein BH23ACT9_BH23ACT9_15560 [soil metagenome]